MAKIMKWVLGIAAVLLAVVIALSCVYLRREWNRTTFFEHTSINGYDVSGKKPEDVLALLKEEYTKANVFLTEGGKQQAQWTLAQVGYTIDEPVLMSGIEDALGKQKSSIPVLLDSLMNGNSFEIDVPFR